MGMTRTRFALPLVSRELFEISARRRTFIQRTVFATVFLGVVYWNHSLMLGTRNSGPFDVLGSGRKMFDELLLWQLWAVLIVMPLISCGAIVQEKQRDTLTLLLTTRTSPAGIIIQKLVSRVCLMLTLLLVALPLVAFAYSLGGVEPGLIAFSFVGLVVLSMLIGSLSIMWSVICSSAVGAYIATVFSGMIMAIPLGCLFGASMTVQGPSQGAWLFLVIPFLGALPSLFCIGIAADRLRESALRPPKNHMAILFKAIDRFFEHYNRITGDIRLIEPRATLPTNDPIKWRETEKKALGQVHHLIRVIVLLELPVILVLLVALQENAGSRGVSFTPMVVMLWIVSVCLILVRTSGLIAAERTRQTLDVLLTTPMSGPSILRQYQAGTRRLMYALSVPFATIFVTNVFARSFSLHSMFYLLGSGLTVVVYMSLCAWLSMWIGLRCRYQLSALMTSLAIAGVWILGPHLIEIGASSFMQPTSLLTPASLVMMLERQIYSGDSNWSALELNWMTLHVATYAAILFAIRWRCLSEADARLGRVEPSRA